MVRRLLFPLLLLASGLTASAQQTLNIHTTTQGTLRFAFATKPIVSFPKADVLCVTCESTVLEFPYAEVEQITFVDEPNRVETLTVREATTRVLVYDLTGKLVHEARPTHGAATIDLSTLPPGVYVVNDGRRTYKVLRR